MLRRGIRLGLDVRAVIVIGDGRLLRELSRLGEIGEEERVRSAVQRIDHLPAEQRVRPLGEVRDAVDAALEGGKVLKLIHFPAADETKALIERELGVLGQDREVEDAGFQHHIVREVSLIDRKRDTQRRARRLNHGVDNAAVVLLPVLCGEGKKTVAD
ncbi:hypothetical protein SDC9_118518 [bioreactor metagenome]|uniref:Uncharacterized protein n=1 Tax=bioreactor metagenome TaxID=1076179 RepID=A0A645C3M2_9ZZZZ